MLQKSGCSLRGHAIRDARDLGVGAALLLLSGAAAAPCAAAPYPLSHHPEAGPYRLLLIQAQTEPATFHASDVSGQAGQPIPLKIEVLGPNGEGESQLFIFSGLPKGVTLQPGGNFGEFWAVNASVIDDLTLTAPPGFSGTFTVWITRSRNQVDTAQSASITVTIGEPVSTPTAASSSAPLPDSTASTKPRAAVPNEAMLMTRAREQFDKGDVSGARVIYEYLATQGSSAAAMAMGETFDPLVLAKLLVKGLEADPKKAQQWYEKAEELGSREARSRLNALAAR